MKTKKIKIALVAPAFGEIGGPEIVTKNLAVALSDLGVDVTLFAPGDWKAEVKLKYVHTLPESLWNMKNFKLQTETERRTLIIESQMKVLEYQQDFDIIHLNSQKYAHMVAEYANKPCLLTFHNKITEPEFTQIRAKGIYTVALSNAHGNGLGIDAVIENGVPVKKIKPSFKKGEYLIVIGRLTEPKGIDVAIEIANKTHKKLLIFGRIGNSQERQEYFNQKIKPFLNEKIVYMGEASQEEILKHLKGAEALLFPIKPKKENLSVCPLVVMEALACGTPVIGAGINPLPEFLRDPRVACLSNDADIFTQAVKNIKSFDRKKCREVAEDNFDSSVMAKNYLKIYENILAGTLDK